MKPSGSPTSVPTIQSRLRSDVELAAQITCIISDVDGVMTDGRIVYGCAVDGAVTIGSAAGPDADAAADPWGVTHEIKAFDVRDGLGIKLWQRSGFRFGIITARESPVVARRAAELGIDQVVQSSKDKWASALEMMQRWEVQPHQVCYIGDDLPDLCVMRRVGLAVAPDDAATDARDHAHWTMARRGGCGVVRELIERLLRGGGRWHAHVDRFSQRSSDDVAAKDA